MGKQHPAPLYFPSLAIMIIQLQYCPLLIQISDIASLVLILLFGHFAFIRQNKGDRKREIKKQICWPRSEAHNQCW